MDPEIELRAALRANADAILRYLERRVVDREDAADLLGEMMLVAWRRLDDLPAHDPTRQRMWLFGIANLTMSNHRRSRRRHGALVERIRSELSVTQSQESDSSDAVAVRDAVERLKRDQRELVRLIHWDGFTLAEAAEVLGLNPSTARSRYAAARAVLRDKLCDTASQPDELVKVVDLAR